MGRLGRGGGFGYSAWRLSECDDAEQTGVVRTHRRGRERNPIVKDSDCHVQVRQMVKGPCFHGASLVIFFMLCGGSRTIHAFTTEDNSLSRNSGLGISLKDAPLWRSHVMEATADASISPS